MLFQNIGLLKGGSVSDEQGEHYTGNSGPLKVTRSLYSRSIPLGMLACSVCRQRLEMCQDKGGRKHRAGIRIKNFQTSLCIMGSGFIHLIRKNHYNIVISLQLIKINGKK